VNKLDDAPVLHHCDPVCVASGVEPVCDRDDRAVGEHGGQGVLEVPRGPRI